MNIEEIKETLLELGKRNDTVELSKSLIDYIERNKAEFQNDYSHTCKEQRFSSGKVEKQVFLKLADICKRQNGNGNASQASHVMILLGYDSYRINSQRFRQKIENLKKMEKAKKKSHRDVYRSSQVRSRKTRKDSESSEFQNSSNEEEDEVEYGRKVTIQSPSSLLPLPPKVAPPPPPPPTYQEPVGQSNNEMLPPLASFSQSVSDFFPSSLDQPQNVSSEMDIMYENPLAVSPSELFYGRQNSRLMTNDIFVSPMGDNSLQPTDSVSICNYNIRNIEYDISIFDEMFRQQQEVIYNNKSTQPGPNTDIGGEEDFQTILDIFQLDDPDGEFGDGFM